MDRTEAPVQPQAEPIGKTITEQDARAQIRGVLEDTKSSSLLVPSIRKHVIDLMREDPTIDDQALLNSQMIDSQLDLFNANLINEYLSALKEIEGVDTNSIPEKYVNKYNIRKVLNKVFQSAGSAQSLRPTKLLNLGTAEESQARRDFYKGMLTDPNFKGPDALDKSQLDKLEGGQAATDDKGHGFHRSVYRESNPTRGYDPRGHSRVSLQQDLKTAKARCTGGLGANLKKVTVNQVCGTS